MRQDFTNAEYTSISDFADAVELPCLHINNAGIWKGFIESDRHNDNWYGAGCTNGRDVLKLMRDGWPEGRDRMNELRDQIGPLAATPIDRRRRRVRGDSGDHLDIHAVYSGRLDIAWTRAKRITTRGPQKIEICANMICSGAEHADVLFWRGAAAATLASMLEQAGYMVRLVVNFGGHTHDDKDGKQKTSCRITVKNHGMPFDVTSTSAVILPGFFRALGHAWIANHAPLKRSMGGISVGQGIVQDGEILISHKVRDHGTAVAFINDVIERVNTGKLAA